MESLQRMPLSHNPRVTVHDLPIEVLTEIFSSAVSPTSPMHMSGVIHVSQDIITLARVCSYWRIVADQDARLWTTIVIRGTTTAEKLRLSECLRRSRTCPINVIVAPLHILADDYRGCITGLQPHMHRIVQLFIKMNNSWVMEEVINCLTTAAPQLRELTLGIIQPELDVDALATPFDSSAPALRTIDSRRWSALFGGHTPALRTFCLSSVCDVLSILEDPPSGMTALHTLVLHGTLRRASYATQVRSRMSHGSWHGFLARVRNLRTLRLVEFTAQNVQECVTALSRSLEGEPGPSLTRLEIVRPGGGFDKPLRDAVEMAVRSVSGRGKLETLVVVPGEEESSSAADWEGLREFCTVKIGEDDGA